MSRAKEYELNFSCVAHLYALFINDLNDAVIRQLAETGDA